MKENIKNLISDLIKEYHSMNDLKKAFNPGVDLVPVSGRVIDNHEISKMIEACLDGFLSSGKFNNEFQDKLANFLGIKLLMTVNSGSSANLVAFSALTSHKLKERKISPGDEVITAAASFPTTVNPIFQNGAIPVFVDSTMSNYNINADLIERSITKKTKAIMIAHTLGNPFDLDIVMGICKKYNLWLIEDNCDALGSKYREKFTGTFGDIATLSFYPAHHITMGEGGAIFTNNMRLKRIAESFRDWGRDCYCESGVDNTCNKRFGWKLGDLPFGYDHKYTYSHMGYNLKITDMQAACGLAQIDKLNDFIKARKNNFRYLYKSLSIFDDIFYLPEATKNSDPSWFGFPLTLKENSGYIREDLIMHLNSKKIGTRLLFAGNITKQPYMKDLKYRISGNLEISDMIMRNTFWLGVYPGLSEEHLNYTVSTIKNFIQR
jgi:CDP-6-deoxy-D-xylo-4-hexulose-3-dehydrase